MESTDRDNDIHVDPPKANNGVDAVISNPDILAHDEDMEVGNNEHQPGIDSKDGNKDNNSVCPTSNERVEAMNTETLNTHTTMGVKSHGNSGETEGQIAGTSLEGNLNCHSVDNSREAVSLVENGSKSVTSNQVVDNQDYETQFFGFTPKSFSDGMYNAVLEYTYTCFQSTIKYMQDKYPSKVSEETAEKATAAILPQLTHAIDKAFDKFESYLKSQICRIPGHVLLAEDAVQAKVTAPGQGQADLDRLDEDIAALEQQIACAKYMNAYMRAELKKLEPVQLMYDQYSHFLNEIQRQCDQAGVPNLKEALVYNSEKAVKIRALLDKLKQHKINQVSLPPIA